ncbi:ALI_HP2_G0017290.mRNA.1.CDS.1 [Saccharomyces cerevisiae]|nr:ALI_HP2_G0017290.mRNA.1.CDS.1 [Saccharomyces cerevisiae]CAI6491560.1 ALI_HP2_G0017290.mRNA.1.CDS.1 [Saccharomyces cerevisiae]CAI6526846.1 ALI_HP1_G0023050.mRNA.1.CDS.1 [Saccharomyces cerevisiae]
MSAVNVAPELINADNTITYDAIVIGAGVIGPCIATGLARKGKKVLIVERDWAMPDRIVGELMQPGGVRALRSLGMIQSINNIEAYPVTGYTVFFNGEQVDIPYPYKADIPKVEKLKDLVKDGNDKVLEDSTIHIKDYEDDERERGVAFVHGRFLNNLRNITAQEPNVTRVQGNCIEILKDEKNEVVGAKVDIDGRGKVEFKAHLTFICDGIFSRFRKELHPDHVPTVGSSFVGMSLFNAKNPAPMHGHVILGSDHMPILVYQISPEETRILCAYNSPKVPADIKSWMIKDVQPFIPKSLRPSFDEAVSQGKFRAMPNSYLPARQNDVTGMCVIGDALNMRHPLTGGGMTVGLHDVVLLIKKIGDLDFSDREKVLDELLDYHFERKSYDSVINVLSVALYSLFAADSDNLKALQKGCFKYFQRGGDCVNKPVEFLSGVLPKPLQLTRVFFAVAFYTIYLNMEERGFLGLPMALLEGIMILITAIRVFTPFLFGELIG